MKWTPKSIRTCIHTSCILSIPCSYHAYAKQLRTYRLKQVGMYRLTQLGTNAPNTISLAGTCSCDNAGTASCSTGTANVRVYASLHVLMYLRASTCCMYVLETQIYTLTSHLRCTLAAAGLATGCACRASVDFYGAEQTSPWSAVSFRLPSGVNTDGCRSHCIHKFVCMPVRMCVPEGSRVYHVTSMLMCVHI
jgi:hypothetical protein